LPRFIRFLFFGGSAAAVNILLMYLLVDLLGLRSVLQQNIANALSIEISLLYSFAVYRLFVWGGTQNAFRIRWYVQLARYHWASAITATLRSFFLFPVLQWLGVHYLVNTLVGIGIGCLLNYNLSGKYVFGTHAADSISIGAEH
jgi:dolichol-phosphate mannosyltransferase